MKVSVLNLEGLKVSELDLNPDVFGLDPNYYCVSNLIRWQLANARSGNHCVKTRSTVTGTGKKNFRQKGTGSARRGSLTVAQFRGGGITFGPVVRDHAMGMNKKERSLAMKSLFSLKFKEGNFFVLENFIVDKVDTKNVLKKIAHLGIDSALFIDDFNESLNFALSVRNSKKYNTLSVEALNGYDILRYDSFVPTLSAIQKMNERFSK